MGALAILPLPFLELAVFFMVAAMVGFGWTLALVLAGSLFGALILRHAASSHIARMHLIFKEGNLAALEADSAGSGSPARRNSVVNSRIYL